VFNGNFSEYFNNNKLFRKFKMGYGAFYDICPEGLQSICYATDDMNDFEHTFKVTDLKMNIYIVFNFINTIYSNFFINT